MGANLFQDIQGHDSVKNNLKQALQSKRLPHALLFSGPSGVGKQKTAWALAQQMLCDQDTACGECYNCLQVVQKKSSYILSIETEKLSLNLQDIEGITPFLSLSTDKAKIVLIDSVEKLNPRASHSLLKIIEEPPSRSFFFLISSESHKLPITLRSRLQRVSFHPLPVEVIKNFVSAEDWIFHSCQGRLDRLEELKNQKELRVISFDFWKFVFEHIFQGSQGLTHLLAFPDSFKKRQEALVVCQYWQQLFRDARIMRAGKAQNLIHSDYKGLIEKTSSLSVIQLDFLLKESLILEKNLKSNIDCVLCFEQFVITIQKLIQDQRYVDRHSCSFG